MLPPGPRGPTEGLRSQASLCWWAAEPRVPAMTQWAGVVQVGKGLRAPQSGTGQQAGHLAAAQRDPARRPGERGGLGFPVALQRTAVTSRGLLGAVRAGGEAQEPCKPASVRILPAPSWPLETLHQRRPQRLTTHRPVTSPLRARHVQPGAGHATARSTQRRRGTGGCQSLARCQTTQGFTCSGADRHLPVQGSPASTDTGGHDPAAHQRIQEGEEGDQLFSLLGKHRGEEKHQQLPPVCFAETLNPC